MYLLIFSFHGNCYVKSVNQQIDLEKNVSIQKYIYLNFKNDGNRLFFKNNILISEFHKKLLIQHNICHYAKSEILTKLVSYN